MSAGPRKVAALNNLKAKYTNMLHALKSFAVEHGFLEAYVPSAFTIALDALRDLHLDPENPAPIRDYRTAKAARAR